jgi:hypothetical protein
MWWSSPLAQGEKSQGGKAVTRDDDHDDDNNNNNNNNNSILYFNVLTQQLQEPITESAQDNNKYTKICLL